MIKMARRERLKKRNMTVVLTVARNLRAAAISVDVLPPDAGASCVRNRQQQRLQR